MEFFVSFRVRRQAAFVSCGRRAPAGGGGSVATGEAPPQAMSLRTRRMLPQGNAPFAGFRGRASAPMIARQRNKETAKSTSSTFLHFYTANLTKVKNENSMRKILSPHLLLLFLAALCGQTVMRCPPTILHYLEFTHFLTVKTHLTPMNKG